MAPYVLVVESDPERQRQIAETLREANYELSTEREAVWARRSLAIRTPDALVVNTRLSDGTGFGVASELRREAGAAGVPVFFLASAFRGPQHAAEARRRFGPAAYLPWPTDPSSLLASVLRAVPPPEGPRRSRVPSSPPPEADEEQAREREQVEATAPQLAASDARIQGNLSQDSFARVLRQLYVERRTGALLMVRDSTKKIVYVEDGYPVAVRSNALSECLGQILLARRRISRSALETSLERMKQEKRRQGDLLVDMGILSPHGLAEALVFQVESKLLDLFSWRGGNFIFKDGWKVEGEAVVLERPTAALILEGVRRHYDDERREQVLAVAAGRFIVPTSDPWLRLQDLTSDPQDRAFMARADGTRSLEEVMNLPPVPRDRAVALMVAMLESGVVQARETPEAPLESEAPREPLAERDVESRPQSEAPRKGPAPLWAPEPQRRSRAELAALVATMRVKTHFEVLDVDAEAPRVVVDAAYEELARTYHPDNFRGRSTTVKELVDHIFARLSEARRTLTDPDLRKSYFVRLERARSHGGAGPDAVTAAEQVYYTGVGHMRDRRYAEAESAFRQATTLVPGQPSYHGALGWAIYRRAPMDPAGATEARSELEHAVALAPDDPWMRVSLGRLLAESGLPDEAVRMFESALKLTPLSAEIEDEMRRLSGDA